MLAAALAYMHEQTWRVTPKKQKMSGGMPALTILLLRFAFRSDRPKWMAFMKHYNHDYRTSLLAIRAWESTPVAPIYGLHYTGAIQGLQL